MTVAVRRELVPSAVLGMAIFIITEVMMFAGLISAFSIARRGAAIEWPPPWQPRLPVEATAVNTLVLLASGALVYLCQRSLRERALLDFRRTFGIAIALGAFFVLVQGAEWVALIGQGLTLTSSPHGSFFYLIVGMHAVHAVAAILALGYVLREQLGKRMTPVMFQTAALFWYFVVTIWPVIFTVVYL